MTNEETIKHINVVKSRIRGGDEAYDLQRKEALNIAIEALEKQIAKKPVRDEEYEFTWLWCCPRCGGRPMENYCANCGQAIDWSDDE